MYYEDKQDQNFVQPLLVDDETLANTPDQKQFLENIQSQNSNMADINFSNFDEKEESTCIKKLAYLKFRPLMFYVAMPVLSIFTLLILPILVYWKKEW